MTEPRFKPYPAYKDSGVEWLGEIPAHWRALALKRIGDLQAGAGFPDDEQGVQDEEIPFFKVGDMGAPGNEREMLVHQHSVSRSTARRLRAHVFPAGTIVFAKVGAALLLNRRRLIARPSCLDNNMMGFMPDDCDATWALYWLTGLDMGRLANPGAVPSVNEGQMRETPAAVPPLPEQRAIAAFLDRETARIDALVAKNERLIALLQEQRTALITRAVTKGLDPTVPMKDSGVEWLGEIPAHWEVKPLKRVFSNLDSMRVPLSGEERATMTKEYPYYGASGIIDHVEDYLFEEPLILVAEDGANLYSRSTPLAFIATGRYWVNNHAHILKPLEGDVSYWAQVLSSVVFDPWISGSAQPKLTGEKLGSIPLPVLPPVERRAIAAFLDRETARIDALIATVRDAIHRLKELRTALISAAVTGKIDVRSLAEASAQGGREVA